VINVLRNFFTLHS